MDDTDFFLIGTDTVPISFRLFAIDQYYCLYRKQSKMCCAINKDSL